MIIALASPAIATSLDDGLEKIEALIAAAGEQRAEIVCFPEAYLPGLRGQEFTPVPWSEREEQQTREAVAGFAKTYGVATILSIESQRHITAVVFDAHGTTLGEQTKNQLDPTEDPYYLPGDTRRVFEVSGVKFGITICHEGWRYPETVRWAASRGAKIVFHPQHTGSDLAGATLSEFGAASNPYYEKAMMMRSRENTIWFASVNYGLRYPEAATAIIAPSGELHAHLSYGGPGLLVSEIDIEQATGLLAMRYAPDRYRESLA